MVTQSAHAVRGGDRLLLWLPLIVLIVPQGTTSRSFVPETIFAAVLFVIALLVFARAALNGRLLSMPRDRINPPLLLLIGYFLLLNPLLSLLYGNDIQRIVITAIPFVLLTVYYLISIRGLGETQTRQMILAFAISGAVISVVVVGNYFLGDVSTYDMRSTNIEGSRSLTLPIIPMAGILFLSLLLSAQKRFAGLMLAGLAAICFIAIIMTVTRAMLLAYLIGAAIVFWLQTTAQVNRRQRRRIVRNLVLLTILSILIFMPFGMPWLNRVNPESDGDVGTILGRFDEYAAFSEGFLNSPIFGQGMGHLFTYPSVFDLALSEIGITVCHSHFFFLAGTTGVLGILLYYGVIGAGIVRYWNICRENRIRNESKGYVIGMLGAAVAGLVFTLSSTTFTTLSYVLFLVIFIHASRLKWSER